MQEVIDDLVAAFGCRSKTELARLCGTSKGVIYHWCQHGVPARRILQIQDLALKQGVELPQSFVEHRAQAARSDGEAA